MPYLNDEPTVESLSQRIDELERIIKSLSDKVERLSRGERDKLPVVPVIPSPGSIGEKNLMLREIAGIADENEQRLAWERVRDARK